MDYLKDNVNLSPHVVVMTSEENEDDNTAYLVVDSIVVDNIRTEDIPFCVLSAYYVFNICYPKGCNNFFSFLEIVILNYSSEKAPPSVKHILAALASHS